ncbi:MAG: hypothetical protein WBS19_04325 [Candidatus Korobacteraceae bacterium]
MRTGNPLPILLVVFALANTWGVTGAFAQVEASPQSHELTWLGMTPGQIFHVDGYELTEILDAETGQRRDYIRDPREPHPREFYHHGRGISVAVVSQCKMLILEDGYTTKLTRLVAVDLPTMKSTQVAADAVPTYEHQTGANLGNFVQVRAVAMSPDCRNLLVSASATYLNAQSPQEAAKESLRFPRQWYVVSLASGNVSVDLRSVKRPDKWY